MQSVCEGGGGGVGVTESDWEVRRKAKIHGLFGHYWNWKASMYDTTTLKIKTSVLPVPKM